MWAPIARSASSCTKGILLCLFEMQALFRKRCDELVASYVKASLTRGSDTREMCRILENRARKDRASARKRVRSLEKEVEHSRKLVEELMWEVEQLHFRVESIERCLPRENHQCLPEPCETSVAPPVKKAFADELEWTRI